MTERRVTVEVDELVLDGFPSLDGRLVGEALQGELARLLRRGDLPAAGFEDARVIDAGSFELDADGDARGIGTRVAGGVYRSLAR